MDYATGVKNLMDLDRKIGKLKKLRAGQLQ